MNQMIRICLLLTIVISVQTTIAQTGSALRQSLDGQGGSKKFTAEQLAELNEAALLSKKVVELHKEHKYDEALALAKRVVQIRERILGDDDGSTAAALVNLAELHLAKEQNGEAQRIYERLLQTYEKIFGVDNVNNTLIIESLALVNYLRGNFKQAETFYSRSLAIKDKALGPEHPDVGRAVYMLAEFYRSIGEYKKAEPLFLRAIAIQDKNPAPRSEDEPNMVLRYECFLYESKGVEEARRLIAQFQRARNPNPPDRNSGGVLNGMALSLPRPAYPPAARRMRAGGVVIIEVTIDESGKVIKAQTVCGHPVLAQASIESALAARFSPTKLSGKPITVKGIIVYNFARF